MWEGFKLGKVKLLILTLLFLIIINGCATEEPLSIEGKVKDILRENHVNFGSVWHMEIKEDVVIVFYENDKKLNIGFVKENQNDWEWITGVGAIDILDGGFIATGKMELPFYLTVVINSNKNVHGISIQGEYAKMVQINPEDKVWFAFSNRPSNGNDIEELK